jgi:glycosyltransferase involved in cell wall biosynthesis
VKPLRIVIVTRRFWPLVGGPERALSDLAVELASRECHATVLTARWQPHWPDVLRLHGVPVVRLAHPSDRGWGNICYLRRLARWLQTNRSQYDLVYVSQLKHEAYAALHAVGREKPVVVRAERSGENGDVQWQRGVFWSSRIMAKLHRSSAVVATTRIVERELLSAGYVASRVHYIPNGVADAVPRSGTTRLAARAMLTDANPELRLADTTFLAVYVGRLEPGCGLERLLDAWEPIAGRRPHAKLWLVGSGSLRNALQRRIESLNLNGRVVLTGAFDDVDGLLAAADLFIRPTPEAGSTLGVAEAFAAGLPVVATDIPGHREWIDHDRDGLLMPMEQNAAWTSILGRVFNEPGLAMRLGAAGRQKIAAFSLAKMADSHVTLFHTVGN